MMESNISNKRSDILKIIIDKCKYKLTKSNKKLKKFINEHDINRIYK